MYLLFQSRISARISSWLLLPQLIILSAPSATILILTPNFFHDFDITLSSSTNVEYCLGLNPFVFNVIFLITYNIRNYRTTVKTEKNKIVNKMISTQSRKTRMLKNTLFSLAPRGFSAWNTLGIRFGVSSGSFSCASFLIKTNSKDRSLTSHPSLALNEGLG